MLSKGPLALAATSLCLSAVLISGCSTSETESRSAAPAEEVVASEQASEFVEPSASETESEVEQEELEVEVDPAAKQQSEVESTLPEGDSWVVSLGDSFISGEAGRWAGNQTWSTSGVDALGASAYADGAGGETITRCHRSKSAAIHIGDVQSLNLACSGAITSTGFDSAGNFKPGLDFYNESGRKGQALLLQEFAQENRVEMVALSIGGNDFKFGPIISECIKSFLQPSVFGSFCRNDSTVQGYVSEAAANRVREGISKAILNISTAMEKAGYQDSDWTLGLQLYPNVIAGPSDMRYSESGYDRQLKGGCGFRDQDSAWAIDTVIPLINRTVTQAAAAAQQERPTLQLITLDASNAFAERTLCHKKVNRVLDSGGASSWADTDAVDKSEWAMEINMVNPNDTYQQESVHPNYWGQLALRSCWRQAWNDGNVRGGACERDGNGLNEFGEPQMRLG